MEFGCMQMILTIASCWSVVCSPLLSSEQTPQRPLKAPVRSASAPGICRWGFRSRGSASCSGVVPLGSAWGQPAGHTRSQQHLLMLNVLYINAAGGANLIFFPFTAHALHCQQCSLVCRHSHMNPRSIHPYSRSSQSPLSGWGQDSAFLINKSYSVPPNNVSNWTCEAWNKKVQLRVHTLNNRWLTSTMPWLIVPYCLFLNSTRLITITVAMATAITSKPISALLPKLKSSPRGR